MPTRFPLHVREQTMLLVTHNEKLADMMPKLLRLAEGVLRKER